MPETIAKKSKSLAALGAPWEAAFGYAQAVRVGDTIYVSGQLSHDEAGQLVAPAATDTSGQIQDYTMMEGQMRQTYVNAQAVLAQFGATLDNVVQETLYVLNVDAAFAVAGAVRREAYAQDRPKVASNLIGVSRLAFPAQLIEIAFQAELGAV
ncbi:MAG: Rid family hydrolase [Brevundimonas sp.]